MGTAPDPWWAYRVPVDPWTALANAAREDEAAGQALVDAAYDQVWRCCAGLVDRESADRLAEETFLRALDGATAPTPDTPGRAWLLSVARATCLEELRARRRLRRRALARRVLRRETPQGLHLVTGAPVVVADLLEHLDPPHRTAFVLTQLVGLGYEEAAQVCDCPVATLRARVARARVRLVGHLGRPGTPGRAGRSDGGARSH